MPQLSHSCLPSLPVSSFVLGTQPWKICSLHWSSLMEQKKLQYFSPLRLNCTLISKENKDRQSLTSMEETAPLYFMANKLLTENRREVPVKDNMFKVYLKIVTLLSGIQRRYQYFYIWLIINIYFRLDERFRLTWYESSCLYTTWRRRARYIYYFSISF